MKLRMEFLTVFAVVVAVFVMALTELAPIRLMMDWRASVNAQGEHILEPPVYQYYDYTGGTEPQITIDFLRGKHFWNPQVAIWIEDLNGNHLQTLMVTTSTAKGLFYSGRTALNFKISDEAKSVENASVRRVDALPYWSHRRGVKYPDGLYSPPTNEPLPDGITGATPVGDFYFSGKGDFEELDALVVMVEVNVAFDENEYFSEYDFPEDTLYHSGTGLLGQPSIVYSASFKRSDTTRYKLMTMIGHGHHSGSSGELFSSLDRLTTAHFITERIVVGVSESWFGKN